MRTKRHRDSVGSWPRWLEPLRPDDVTRARIERRVREQAEPLLHARGAAAGWQSVAARWAVPLAPIAAVLTVAFGVLAYRAMPGEPASTEAAPLTVEQLVAEDPEDAFPALLTSATEPSKSHVLEAAMTGRALRP
jgi:hypothetical protein